MSENLLTSEEREALREGMPKEPGPADIDLGRSDRSLRRHIPGLERGLVAFGLAVESWLSKDLRARCKCEADPAEVIGPQVGQDALQSLSLVASLNHPDGEPAAYLGLDAALSFHLIEAAFGGGSLGSPAPVERSALTGVERATLWPTLQSAAHDLLGAIADYCGEGAQPELAAPGPEFPQGTETVLVWRFVISEASDIGTLSIFFLPHCFVGREASVGNAPSPSQAHISSALIAADIEVSSSLGTTGISIADLLALREGDIVRLDSNQSEPVPVQIEGSTKFLAKPLQRNGVYGVEIEKVIP